MGDNPPLSDVAVNVTKVPAQTGFSALTETLTGWSCKISMVMEFDVAGLFEIQTVFEEVIVQFTTSAFAGVYVKIESLRPETTPFTFH
jgi:hypothetical protein